MKNHLTDEERSHRQTEIRNAQTEMFVLQSDKKRIERKHNDLLAEIREMQRDLAHLKASLTEKTEAERTLAKEIAAIDEALTHTKKQMDTIK
jgi:chromosome segregation ATPase